MNEELMTTPKPPVVEAEVLSTESAPVEKPEKVIAKVGAITDAIKDEHLLIASYEKSIAAAQTRIRKQRESIAKCKQIIIQLERANKLKQS
jgi:hypothetical protein